MSSIFDSEVYQRRNHTPWTQISLHDFIKEMLYNDYDAEANQDTGVILECKYNSRMDTRKMWTLTWTGEDGKRHSVWSKHYYLVLWRAAQMELNTRQRVSAEKSRDEMKICQDAHLPNECPNCGAK